MGRNRDKSELSLLVSGLSLALFAAFALLISLAPTAVENINAVGISVVGQIRLPELTVFLLALTDLVEPVPALLLLTVLFIPILRAKDYTALLSIAGVIVGAIVLISAFKLLFAVPRPLGSLFVETGYSFPSAHAGVSSAFVSAFIVNARSAYEKVFSRNVFFVLRAALIIVALLIILSRAYFGVHTLLDVIAGTGLGVGLGLLSVKLR